MSRLAEHLAGLTRGRTLIVVGVGNPLRGDDGAGPLVIEKLGGHDGVRRIDAGTTPENWYGPLLAHAPAIVLFVDAADHGARPGECVLVPADDLAPRDGGTHAPTLRLLAHLLAPRGIDSWLLGIQPARTATGATLHPAVGAAVDEVVAAIAAAQPAEACHA
jgi:hydrogenase 3 maturation protease